MYHVTYQFNETAIITVTAIGASLGNDSCVIQDKQGVSHSLPSDSLISVVPIRHVRRRSRQTAKAPAPASRPIGDVQGPLNIEPSIQ